MAITPPRFNPSQPIPNNPFYSPQSEYIQSSYGPLIVGSGLTVNYAAGTLNATGGGGGAVSQIVAGSGITVTPPAGTGTVTVAMALSGVTAGTYNNATVVVDQFGRVTSASSGTAGTVTSINTGTGLTGGPITTTGSISLANTAVTPGSYTAADITVDAQGRLTAAANGSVISTSILTAKGTLISASAPGVPLALPVGTAGQVLTVDATAPTGLAWTSLAPGGVTNVTGTAPIVSTGGATPDISLANTTVTPGSYTYSSFTVDAQGRLTAASSGVAPNTTVIAPITNTGTAAAPIIGIATASVGQLGAVQVGSNIQVSAGTISVNSASTTQPGVVQLFNGTNSTSTTLALTASQGKSLQDQIDSLAIATNLTLAGTLNAASGLIDSVSAAGTAAGFVVGNPLPSPAAGNLDYFVIVDVTSASYSPPGGGGPYVATQGDWFLSNGTTWQHLNVGPIPDAASTTTPGIVQLATTGDTQAGVSGTLAITPSGAAATYVAFSDYTAKGSLLAGTGPSTVSDLAIGIDGQVLTACSAAPTGLCWTAASTPAIPCSTFTALGQLIAGTGAGTFTTVQATGIGLILTSNSLAPSGMQWTTPTFVRCSSFTTKGDILAGTGLGTFSALGIGTDGQVLIADSACTNGVKWAAASVPAIPCACLSAKGSLVTATAAATPVDLPVGTNGQLLVADSTCASGLKWSSNLATPTIYGMVQGCTIANNTALGCNALAAAGALSGQTAVGVNALTANNAGLSNVAVGCNALCTSTSGNQNVAVGTNALCAATGTGNTGVGHGVLTALTSGATNTAIGAGAGCNITTGSKNVAIGVDASVANAAGDCQLTIGFANNANWLTGDSGKNITPGAGIRDCAGNLGTAGQALTSTGTALEWAGPFVPNACFTAKGSVVVGCAASTPYALGAAPADRYTLVSCAACPGGVDWSGVLSILGDYPVGATTFFAGSVAPLGWLIADGRAVSRVSYGALFDVIGTTYGAGDGSTTFNLPDLRGMFTRGWDAAGGTARGCDPGRVFGSTQGCAIQSHCHAEALPQGVGACVAGAGSLIIGTAGGSCCTGVNTATTGGTETRPMNVAMLPCIKYEVTNAPLTPSSGIPCACITAQGVLLTGSAASTPVALPAGVKGSILVPNTSCALGLEWAAPGANGQVLMACSACANGTMWQTGAVGSWIDAGTIQSVGWGATTTAPTIGTTVQNNVRYRQLGPKAWEVVYSFNRTVATGATAGSGDYLFTLPGGLQWDTTLPFQTIYNGDVGTDLYTWFGRTVPSGVGSIYELNADASTKGLYIVVYSSTQFRVIATTSINNKIVPIASAWYPANRTSLGFHWTFQVTTP